LKRIQSSILINADRFCLKFEREQKSSYLSKILYVNHGRAVFAPCRHAPARRAFTATPHKMIETGKKGARDRLRRDREVAAIARFGV
jgi:hypothetical protein